MADPVPNLSAQQQTFVEEYCKDKNGVRAALAAGLSGDYFAAASAARELLKKPQIRAAVKAVFRVQARRLKTEVPDIVREWAAIGRADLTDYAVEAGGRLTVQPGVPRAALRAVKKVKQTRTERLRGDELTVETRTEIELHDKLGALTKLYERLHGALPGEKEKGASVEDVTRLLAEHRARADDGGRGGADGGDAVGAEPGAAEPGVPE